MTVGVRACRRTPSARSLRCGYTLLELSVVVALVAIAALLVTPQWWPADAEPADAAETLRTQLEEARDQARRARQVVTVRVDAALGRLTVDTSGTSGRDRWRDVPLPDASRGAFEPADLRATFVFRPTGAATGDSVRVRTAQGVVRLSVDAWSGEVRVATR